MSKNDDYNKAEWSDDDHDEDEGSDDDHDEDEGSDDDDDHGCTNFFLELCKIACLDDRHGFKKLMEGPDRRIAMFRRPWRLIRQLCRQGAVNCATALLEGEVDPPLELSVDPKFGLCPLHVATDEMSYSMVDLLLRYGAPTDLKSIAKIASQGGMLPLNVALEMLRYRNYLVGWTPKDPVLKLIILLCLPKMRVPREIIRLLAWNTKRVDDVFYYYFMEGKLIEMAALLLVAREKVMAGFNGRMHLRQFISEETAVMLADEKKLTGCGNRGKWASVFKDKRLVMTSALELLELFERAGDCIEAYAQSVRSEITEQEVVKDITFLLEENGFDLKGEDIDLNNIDCALHVDEKIKLEMQGLENGSGFLGQLSGHFDAEKHLVANRMIVNSLPERGLFLPSTPLFRLPSHLFSFHPYSTGASSSSFHQKKTTTAKSLTDLLSAKTYGRFALLIKRGIRVI